LQIQFNVYLAHNDDGIYTEYEEHQQWRKKRLSLGEHTREKERIVRVG